MNSKILNLLLVGCVLLTGACVEIRDVDDSASPGNAKVQTQSMQRLVVTGTMYIYKGKIISQEELDFELHKSGGAMDRSTQDLEYRFTDLEFENGAKLLTLGNRVRIYAQKLTADEGTIETFPEGQKASAGNEGRSGGYLYLKVGQAIGSISVLMRGEHGADGVNGKAPDEKLRGRDGTRKDGMRFGDCSGDLESLRAEDGGKGLQGYAGSPGKDGGDSGSYEFTVDDKTQLKHFVNRYPGSGGQGGAGGRGGEGGKAGNPGFRSEALNGKSCLGKMGKDGDAGDRGLDGPSGKDGQLSPLCYVNSGVATCY